MVVGQSAPKYFIVDLCILVLFVSFMINGEEYYVMVKIVI